MPRLGSTVVLRIFGSWFSLLSGVGSIQAPGPEVRRRNLVPCKAMERLEGIVAASQNGAVSEPMDGLTSRSILLLLEVSFAACHHIHIATRSVSETSRRRQPAMTATTGSRSPKAILAF